MARNNRTGCSHVKLPQACLGKDSEVTHLCKTTILGNTFYGGTICPRHKDHLSRMVHQAYETC